MGERRDDPGDEVERRVHERAESTLDVVAEDVQEQHVPEEVREPPVHEHRREEGQVERVGTVRVGGRGSVVPSGSWTGTGPMRSSPVRISCGMAEYAMVKASSGSWRRKNTARLAAVTAGLAGGIPPR